MSYGLSLKHILRECTCMPSLSQSQHTEMLAGLSGLAALKVQLLIKLDHL